MPEIKNVMEDFDGDTVVVVPLNDKGKIKTKTSNLLKLKCDNRKSTFSRGKVQVLRR